MFLSTKSSSIAAVAHQFLKELWRTLRTLPVLFCLLADDQSAEALLPYLREHPDEVDNMLTPRTQRNAAYTLYCDRKIPGMDGKTCRDVGAHEKKKSENKTAARREYSRIHNRLKAGNSGAKSPWKNGTARWFTLRNCGQSLKWAASRRRNTWRS